MESGGAENFRLQPKRGFGSAHGRADHSTRTARDVSGWVGELPDHRRGQFAGPAHRIESPASGWHRVSSRTGDQSRSGRGATAVYGARPRHYQTEGSRSGDSAAERGSGTTGSGTHGPIGSHQSGTRSVQLFGVA